MKSVSAANDALPEDSLRSRGLIPTLQEFQFYAQWHAGWTLLARANPGLAFAVAVLLPWRTDGYHALHTDLDRCLAASREDLLEQTGLPSGEETLRILERFDRRWWVDLESGNEARAVLLMLGSLLQFEPEAAALFMRQDTLACDDVVQLATGLGANPWVCSVLFRADHMQRTEWFFRLPFARRCWLARTFWDLHGKHQGDFVTELVERAEFPAIPHLDAFRDEEHAVASSIRLREMRQQLERRCFEAARLLPWPAPVLLGSETIVPVRNLGEAYPENQLSDFAEFDPRYSLDIPLGRLCLYRLRQPITALVAVEFPSEQEAWAGEREWRLRSVLSWRDQAGLQDAEAHVKRWLEDQPKEFRCRPAPSKFMEEMQAIVPR